MNWHQEQAVKRHIRTKNHRAHVYESPMSVTSLCGIKHPTVTVSAEHASTDNNSNVCLTCARMATKQLTNP